MKYKACLKSEGFTVHINEVFDNKEQAANKIKKDYIKDLDLWLADGFKLEFTEVKGEG